VVQFDFENNKKLMVKIEIEIREEKEIKAQKREKLNKEINEIIIEKENIILNFFKLN